MALKTVELAPIPVHLSEYDAIEKRIKDAFLELLYKPILRIIDGTGDTRVSRVTNASITALFYALQSGRVHYAHGRFSGSFSAAVSKELRDLGANYDRSSKTYSLDKKFLPPDIRVAVQASEDRFKKKLASIDMKLGKFLPEEITDKVKVEKFFDSALWKVDRKVSKSLKPIAIQPTLPDRQRKKIAEEWQENLDLYIKGFAEEEILKLRRQVRESVEAGGRRAELVKLIQASYNVTANKAKFLARQETSLMMTKFKETRYTSSGVTQYKWLCVAGSKNHPVRPAHKILEGKIFSWNDPPITSEPGEPVRRNNPGQDFNCRCTAKPVVTFRTESS